MSSNENDELEIEEHPEATPPDSQDDAHVDDDVCVAVFAAAPAKRRRRDVTWIAAIGISLVCHMALAAAWWEWRTTVEMPDFAINSGVGGTIGTGTTDDESAAPPARSALPPREVNESVPMSDANGALEDEPTSPSIARPSKSTLRDSVLPPGDLIGMGGGGWSPDVVPSRGAAVASSGVQNAPSADSTRVAPLQEGTGGGGDGLAITSLSTRAANDPPTYPEQARRQRQEGTVLLQLLITADVHVKDVKILRSSGYALLDGEAVRKFSTYIVNPYRENGVAMDVIINDVPVVFRLRSSTK